MTAEFNVILFKSVHHAMKAEKILCKEQTPHKLIPVPKHISSDCGVCIRFLPDRSQDVRNALDGRAEFSEIRPLQ